MDINLAEVPVDRLQTIAMVDDNAVAIDSERRGPDHATVIRRLHAHMLRARQVVSKVGLLIDPLAVVDVIAHIGEIGLDLGVGLLQKRLRPQKLRLCFRLQICERLVVRLPHPAVDAYEALDHVPGAIRIEFVYDFLNELVVDLQIADAVLWLFPFREVDDHLSMRLVAAGSGGIDQGRNVQRHVPGKRKERELARFPARHRPAAKGLVTNANAGGGRRARDVVGDQIGHADIQVVLVGIDAHLHRLSYDGHIARNLDCLTAKVVRGGRNDQTSRTAFELWSTLHSSRKLQRVLRRLTQPAKPPRRMLHVSQLVTLAVLLDVRCGPAYPMRICDAHRNRRCLANRADRSRKGDNRSR